MYKFGQNYNKFPKFYRKELFLLKFYRDGSVRKIGQQAL